MYYVFFLGSLKEEHILKLCERITSERELLDFGVRVLKLPDYDIKRAMSDKKGHMIPATHAVLTRWLLKQKSRQDAYTVLLNSLQECGMNQLWTELRQWVEGTPVPVSDEQPSSASKASSIGGFMLILEISRFEFLN